MKLRAAETHEGVGHLENRRVVAGEKYGHLRVVEEVAGRRIQNSRAWRVVCENVKDGKVCGAELLKPTHYLTKISFRACPSCADAHQREVRQGWSRAMTRR